MTLKSIDKYLARYTAPEVYPWVSEMLRDIQDEVDSSYMELPVDADGVPIRCGERMRLDNGHEGEVWLIGVFDIMMSDHTCFDWAKSRHVKPRTLEDVLEDFVRHGVEPISKENREVDLTDVAFCIDKGEMRKYAAEIRDLLGGDER